MNKTHLFGNWTHLPYYHWSCPAPAAAGGSADLSGRSPDSSPPEGQKAAEGWIHRCPLRAALSECPQSPKRTDTMRTFSHPP